MIRGVNITGIWVDEMDTNINNIRIQILQNLLTSKYKYTNYIRDSHMEGLVDLGYVHVKSLAYDRCTVSGFFTVTELGKTWLEFNKL